MDGLDGNCFFYDSDLSINSVHGAIKMSSLEELITKSDIICLCASFEINNRNFFNKKYIDLLENKYFVNSSRGELVDELYLIDKIKKDFFKGVAIDVIENESKQKNNLNEFYSIDETLNFIMTPHIAGATFTSMKRTEDFITKKLINLIDDKD